MPETTMDEYYCTVFGKNHIRLARQVLHMKSISKTHPMQEMSQKQFRPGILSLDTNRQPKYILYVFCVAHNCCFMLELTGI